jgi:putative spermidine/putrescine transport system permease protein
MKRFSSAAFRFLLYAILVAPLLLFGVYAFSERWFYPELFPTSWTTAPFLRLLSDYRTSAGLLVSLGIAGIVSLLSLIVGYPAARILGTRTFRGRQLAWLAFFLPTVIPPLAIGMGLNILFLRLGLAGSIVGVILSHLVPTLPYTIFTLSGLFARYDDNFEYQAQVLGASRLRIFFTITLRLVFPGLVVAGLFAFLISWSQYLLTLLIGGGQVLTLPLLLFSAVSGGNPTTIAALSLLFVAPPVLVIAATAQYLNRHGENIREQY